MARNIRSAKAKGARFQSEVQAMLVDAIPAVAARDIISTPMGRNGADLLLSREAQGLFPFAIECKNTETLQFWRCMNQTLRHAHLEREDVLPLLVFKRNRRQPYCALRSADWHSLATAAHAPATAILEAAAQRYQGKPGARKKTKAKAKAAADSKSSNKKTNAKKPAATASKAAKAAKAASSETAVRDASSGSAKEIMASLIIPESVTGPAEQLYRLYGMEVCSDRLNIWRYLEALEKECARTSLLPYLTLRRCKQNAQLTFLDAQHSFDVLPFHVFLDIFATAAASGWQYDTTTSIATIARPHNTSAATGAAAGAVADAHTSAHGVTAAPRPSTATATPFVDDGAGLAAAHMAASSQFSVGVSTGAAAICISGGGGGVGGRQPLTIISHGAPTAVHVQW